MTTAHFRGLPLLAVSLLAACAAPQATHPITATPAASGPVEVGIIGINDFHGALEPPGQSVNVKQADGTLLPVPAGGGAWLASAVDSIKARHANNVVVAAGDLTSASQLASSLYLDEPAVGVMNRVGVEFNAVGNHEFDRGWKELQRLQNGGCEKTGRLRPCQLEQFAGAQYKYLSAATFKADGTTLFPATGLKTFGSGANKVTIGFVGLSLKSVPTLVSPDQVAGLTFGDEAEAINKAIPVLRAEGADAVVVLIHQGGKTPVGDPNGCADFAGDITPILDHLAPGVDVVVSGHTHWSYVCDYKPANGNAPILLTSAGVYGELVTDITLKIDPSAHRVISKAAHNVIVQSTPYKATRGDIANTDAFPRFEPRADVAAYVKQYKDASLSLVARPVGKIVGAAAKSDGEESGTGGSLGNLIADGQLAATRVVGAQVSFTNPFGIRASLVPAADGTVTFGQLYAVQPFNNELVTMTLTGDQLRAVIEEGLDDNGPKQVLSPSAGLMFRYDMTRPSGSRIKTLTLDGKPVAGRASYRVSVVNFLAEGGDGYTTFTKGTDRVRGAIDIEAFEDWIKAVPVRQVPQENRAVQVGK
ncbi:bifunctional UDP-sugar hydrolase/5'-nucleotidase [Novosphingobium sp. AP12]|uniref:bifunctional metallophosphatase/5'-nucleotidase n=1 Tax=Novosphingobium sp. AP12 TaxID=1144305 RepID=UPI00027205CC|nr:bifunctional metallophosphatase/5'-nucleotidase [Novosphingobium sp. AP12]EJL24157.1 5'-nucleotidase/2',3'-cyclic phosphodiesterase-like hydrolase [Novosphingobium sp. AP12]